MCATPHACAQVHVQVVQRAGAGVDAHVMPKTGRTTRSSSTSRTKGLTTKAPALDAGGKAHQKARPGEGSPTRRNPLHETRNPLKLDRRREERHVIEENRRASVSATYSDGSTRFGITHFDILDESRSGLGVRSTTLIEPGMNVVICPPGSRIPWLAARAVRCAPEPEGRSFRVGLALTGPAGGRAA